VHRLLAKSPAARYQTAADLGADLAGAHRQLELNALVPQAVSGKDAIAVLPFTLLTPSRDDDYLGGALADAIINQLGQSGKVLVRPISAVMRYANQPVDPVVAGRELNVKVVVGGSVQRVDRRLRVHVQALNVRDGSTVAAARHEAEMSDLFALQDAVAEGLTRALGITCRDKHPSAAPPTMNPKAYELFLRACERLSRTNRWDARTAVDMLEDVTRLDPTFADAWARLGEGYMTMHQSFDPAGDWYPKAQKAIRRAIALQPQSASAHAARAWSLWSPTAGFKIRAVLRATTTAIRLNPACQSAWLRQGTVLHHIGLQDEARVCLLAALEMNPDDAFCLTFIGQTFLGVGDYDGADDFIARALRLDRAGLYVHLFRPAIALYRGRDDMLLRTIQEARATVGDDPLFHAYEAVFHARDGRSAKARGSLRKALAGRSQTHTHHTMHFAGAARALLEDRTRSVALIKKAASTGLPSYTTFRDDPFLVSLRGFGPFVNLLGALKKEVAGYRLQLGDTLVNAPAAGVAKSG
jgi:TolB-like protein/tetratricopeptide (TPR) repeat protein